MYRYAIFLLCIALWFGGTAAASASAPGGGARCDVQMRARPGTVSGCVALPGGDLGTRVDILITGTTSAGQRTSFNVTPEEDGSYSLRVPEGLYKVYAWADVPLGGEPYRVLLYPHDRADRSMSSATGIVKHFSPRASGPLPGLPRSENPAQYYGGTLTVSGDDFRTAGRLGGSRQVRYPIGSKLRITLAARDVRVDGMAAEPLVFEKSMQEETFSSWTLRDVPLAEYDATADLVHPDGTVQPLQVGAEITHNHNYRTTPAVLGDEARFLFPAFRNRWPYAGPTHRGGSVVLYVISSGTAEPTSSTPSGESDEDAEEMDQDATGADGPPAPGAEKQVFRAGDRVDFYDWSKGTWQPGVVVEVARQVGEMFYKVQLSGGGTVDVLANKLRPATRR
jgi:hypothetical protein